MASANVEVVRRAHAAFFEVSLVEVLHEAGDHVVVEEHLRARGLGTGVELESQMFSAYFFRDVKLAQRQIFTEKAEALGRVRSVS
jgi:ketosteroid isomerase-like protein